MKAPRSAEAWFTTSGAVLAPSRFRKIHATAPIAYCQDLLPQLDPVLAGFASDFRVLGVTSDTLETGGALLKKEFSFSVVRVDDNTLNRLGLTAVPQVFVLDPDGNVRAKWVGYMAGDKLVALEALLSTWSDT